MPGVGDEGLNMKHEDSPSSIIIINYIGFEIISKLLHYMRMVATTSPRSGLSNKLNTSVEEMSDIIFKKTIGHFSQMLCRAL